MRIETAQCGLVMFESGELVYITNGFDRTEDGLKLHKEDLIQCFDLSINCKYDKTYEEAGRLISEITNGNQALLLEFVRRVIIAYVIGNDDMHLKNFSIQQLPNNSSRFYDQLTPSYDCLFFDALVAKNSNLGKLGLGIESEILVIMPIHAAVKVG